MTTTMLVTGGAGFIGSNFVRYLLCSGPADLRVVNLDLLTYAGNPDNLSDIDGRFAGRYFFVHGDICDRPLVEQVFARFSPDWVVNCAAESHVDRSIQEPATFVQTNVVGTATLLQVAREHWPVGEWPARRFLQVSTDEVYGSLSEDARSARFTERSPISPRSPYSASKASADLLVKAYCETYGFPAIVTRCSNNYGPYQFPEKLIPRMITWAVQGKPLLVYGDGRHVRDWIFVADHCAALWTVLLKGRPGEVYNIGASNERENLQVVEMLLDILGKPRSLIQLTQDRPGHDRRYALDTAKIQQELGWRPEHVFEQQLAATVLWYLAHWKWVERIFSGEYRRVIAVDGMRR